MAGTRERTRRRLIYRQKKIADFSLSDLASSAAESRAIESPKPYGEFLFPVANQRRGWGDFMLIIFEGRGIGGA